MLSKKSVGLLLSIVSMMVIACNSTTESTSTETSDTKKESVIPQVGFGEIEKILALQDDTLRVVNFWATWCKPCVEELPILEQLAKENKGSAFATYYISLDFPNQIESKLVPFLKENPLHGKVIVLDDPDANTWIDKVNPNWSGAIPATIISRGDKNQFHEGQLNSFEDMQKLIAQLESTNS